VLVETRGRERNVPQPTVSTKLRKDVVQICGISGCPSNKFELSTTTWVILLGECSLVMIPASPCNVHDPISVLRENEQIIES
jgi:hypothetical protein